MKKIKTLQLETDWLEIGRILKHIGTRMRGGKYGEMLKELEMSDRTAFYLVAIVTRLDNRMIKVPEDIGWRKLAEVAPLITYDNHKVIFRKIRKHTREELIKMKKAGILTQGEGK